MVLKNKLLECWMTKSVNVISYLMRIIHPWSSCNSWRKDRGCRANECSFKWVYQALGIACEGDLSWGEYSKLAKTMGWLHSGGDLRESRANKYGGGDENLALINKMKKGKGNFFIKKGNNEGEGHHFEKKKEISKIKCFVCHKQDHYASQCQEKKDGKDKTQ